MLLIDFRLPLCIILETIMQVECLLLRLDYLIIIFTVPLNCPQHQSISSATDFHSQKFFLRASLEAAYSTCEILHIAFKRKLCYHDRFAPRLAFLTTSRRKLAYDAMLSRPQFVSGRTCSYSALLLSRRVVQFPKSSLELTLLHVAHLIIILYKFCRLRNTLSSFSLWEETGEPGENPRLSAEF